MNNPPTIYTPFFRQRCPWEYHNFCWFCGIKLTRRRKKQRTSPRYRTRDHVVPKSRFPKGTSHVGNTVFACAKCNRSKGNRGLEEYRATFGAGHIFFAEARERELEPPPALEFSCTPLYYKN